MKKTYPNLKALLASESQAYDFFATLPQYVREHIADQSDGVNSFESLKSFADTFTQGDH